MLDATKSLIYNISLMAGQTGGYDLRVRGLYRQMARPTWKMVHRDVNRTCNSDPNGKESRSFAAGFFCGLREGAHRRKQGNDCGRGA